MISAVGYDVLCNSLLNRDRDARPQLGAFGCILLFLYNAKAVDQVKNVPSACKVSSENKTLR